MDPAPRRIDGIASQCGGRMGHGRTQIGYVVPHPIASSRSSGVAVWGPKRLLEQPFQLSSTPGRYRRYVPDSAHPKGMVRSASPLDRNKVRTTLY